MFDDCIASMWLKHQSLCYSATLPSNSSTQTAPLPCTALCLQVDR